MSKSNLESFAAIFAVLTFAIGFYLGLELPWLIFIWALNSAQLIEVTFYAEFLKMSKQQEASK